MPLSWDPTNLIGHTAKHYLGEIAEGWRDLGGAPPAQWDAWRRGADEVQCRYAEHRDRCPADAACEPIHQEASGAYRALVDKDWAFAEARGLLVYYPESDGSQGLCGTGPGGVFVAAVQRTAGERVAKTGFRPIENPRTGPDAVLGAVRKMRAHASTRSGGWTLSDLVRLETHLLRRLPAGADTTQQLAGALRRNP
jgi:hypothetical protein